MKREEMGEEDTKQEIDKFTRNFSSRVHIKLQEKSHMQSVCPFEWGPLIG